MQLTPRPGNARSVRSDYFDRVAAIGKQAGVEGIGLIGHVTFFQQQPLALAIPAVVDGIHQLIVVVVVRAPFHADGIAIMRAGNRRIEMRAGRSADDRFRDSSLWTSEAAGNEPRLHRDVIDSGATFLGR